MRVYLTMVRFRLHIKYIVVSIRKQFVLFIINLINVLLKVLFLIYSSVGSSNLLIFF